jgi:inner membrane protein
VLTASRQPRIDVDNLTHALVGAALSKAGLERRTPLATATLVLAANAPDVDIFAYANGPYFGLAFRRGITHGVPALIVLPFAVGGLVLAWDRRVRRRRDPLAPPARTRWVFALALLGVLTHPLLDWMNNYGMRWWLPFDGRWSYGDSLFIIDPWLWLLLGGAVFFSRGWPRNGRLAWAVLALLATLVISLGPVPMAARVIWCAALLGMTVFAAKGPQPREHGRAGMVTAAVGVAGTYVIAMMASSAFARGAAERAARGQGVGGVQEVMIFPTPADPFAWTVAIRTDHGFVRGSHRWTRRPIVRLEPEAPVPFRAALGGISPAEVDAAVALAGRDQNVRSYLLWARSPYWIVAPAPGGYRVRVTDIRYEHRSGSIAGTEIHVPRALLP